MGICAYVSAGALSSQKRAIGSSRSGVRGGCELPSVSFGKQTCKRRMCSYLLSHLPSSFPSQFCMIMWMHMEA